MSIFFFSLLAVCLLLQETLIILYTGNSSSSRQTSFCWDLKLIWQFSQLKIWFSNSSNRYFSWLRKSEKRERKEKRMDVIKSQQISARPIEKVVVHPLVLLSIVDHYNRVARDTKKRVVGVLLGTSFRGTVDVTNSYAGSRSDNFLFFFFTHLKFRIWPAFVQFILFYWEVNDILEERKSLRCRMR